MVEKHHITEKIDGDNGELSDVLVCNIIRITGQPENVAAAKQALLDLVPITIEVSIF